MTYTAEEQINALMKHNVQLQAMVHNIVKEIVDCVICKGTAIHACKCGDSHPCCACDSGKMNVYIESQPVGDASLQSHYIRKIGNLPNVQFAGSTKDQVFFIFDGGAGTCMGLC